MEFVSKIFESPTEAKNAPPANTLPDAIQNVERVSKGDKEEITQSISVKLETLPHSLVAKNLEHWAAARSSALNPYYPRRWQYTELCLDVLNDLHLSGCIEKRILKITNRKFKMCFLDGKKDDETTARLNKQWFRSFREKSMEARPHGFSLVQLMGDKEITHCDVVDRRYVVPEMGIFITKMGDTMGYDYNSDPLKKYCVPVGNPKDLGWLMSLSIYALLKKAAIGNWAEFQEIFGMPIRIAKVNTKDPAVRDDVANMLDEMGSAAWGLFPMGTEVDIKGDSRTDAYKVYDLFIERINSEFSKKILGGTMGIDNGSSRSQAEVHERGEDEITNDDKAFMYFVINDILYPRLVEYWGFPKDRYFDWDDAETMDLKKRSEIDLSITQMGYKPTKKYLEETYSIELEEPKPQPEAIQEGDKQKDPLKAEKGAIEPTARVIYTDITSKINDLYSV